MKIWSTLISSSSTAWLKTLKFAMFVDMSVSRISDRNFILTFNIRELFLNEIEEAYLVTY